MFSHIVRAVDGLKCNILKKNDEAAKLENTYDDWII